MSTLIKFYNGTVTSGGKDGDELSEGTNANPLSFTLNAAINEAKCAKVAIRCKDGYATYGTTKVSAYHNTGSGYEPTGGDVDKWSFAVDDNYASAEDALAKATWKDSIEFADDITDKNTVFWVKAASNSAEVPSNDTSTVLYCTTVIRAV